MAQVMGLLPDGNKPLPEQMLTTHQSGIVAFTWGHFPRDTSAINQLIQIKITYLKLHLNLAGVND